MGAVKESKAACLGDYRNVGACRGCLLEQPCIDLTLEADGYYDELAYREEVLRDEAAGPTSFVYPVRKGTGR